MLSALTILPDARAAALQPDELLLIYNAQSAESYRLAQYYSEKRGVPSDQMLGLTMDLVETLPRADYEQYVVPRVREALRNHDWGRRIRCLVTFYDVPLRVGRFHPSEADRQRSDMMHRGLVVTLEKIDHLLAEMTQFVTGNQSEFPIPTPMVDGRPRELNLTEIQERYMRYRSLRERMLGRLKTDGSAWTEEARKQTMDIIVRAEGRVGVLKHTKALNDTFGLDWMTLNEQAIEVQQSIRELLALSRSNYERNKLVGLVSQNEGMFALANLLDDDRRALEGIETEASFDNELALVLIDQPDTYRWIRSSLYYHGDERHQVGPMFMTARVDAPTPALAMRMIDHSLAAEEVGLQGRVYIDTRSLPNQHEMAKYDGDLFRFGKLLKSKTRLTVIMDIQGDVFQPGQCPNAAVYVGWYSVGKYVDAFDWVPGAFGYHIASSELISLRNPLTNYWCPEMIKDGVAATLGPTNEPYLHSFPKPTEITGLVLTGEYSLAECFWYTNPLASWKMTLLGDPLYRPFKVNPQLSVGDVFDQTMLPLTPISAPLAR
jgi:uncharacterized protein (TIGR03790 family)